MAGAGTPVPPPGGGAGTPRRGRAPDEGSRKEKMLRELGEEKGEQRSIMNTEVESGLGPD